MISLKSRSNDQKGFTIVELLIVIIVIGILAAIAFVAYGNVTKKARDSERTADAKAISSKAEEYYANNAAYPTLAQLNAVQGLNAASKVTPTGGAIVDCGTTLGTPTTTVGSGANDVYCYANNGTQFQLYYWNEAGNTAASVTGSNN